MVFHNKEISFLKNEAKKVLENMKIQGFFTIVFFFPITFALFVKIESFCGNVLRFLWNFSGKKSVFLFI